MNEKRPAYLAPGGNPVATSTKTPRFPKQSNDPERSC
jgi:hypothetical protein